MQLLALKAVLTAHLALVSGGVIDSKTQSGSASSGFQWPWSTKSGQHILLPGRSFDADVSSLSPRCLWAVMRVSSKFDTSCFQSSRSLYFSTPSAICSEKCLDTTIQLSQYMVDMCSLDKKQGNSPAGYSHKDVVYLSWADRDLANVVCKGSPNNSTPEGAENNSPGQCYSTVFAAETVREAEAFASGSMDTQQGVCNGCTHEWVKAIRASKHRASPLLYYGHIPDAVRLASWISEKCDYGLTPI